MSIPSALGRALGKTFGPIIWPRLRINSGAEYETFIARELQKRGWKVTHIGGANDQGIDLLALKRGRKVGVQCKWKNGPDRSVGNEGVQQVFAGTMVHDCKWGVVISNGVFTKGAKKSAKHTQVILLRDSELKKLSDLVGIPPLWKTTARWAGGLGIAATLFAIAYVEAPNASWHKTGPEPRFIVAPMPPRHTDTTSVGGPSPITPPTHVHIGLPEGSLVLRCVNWGETEKKHGAKLEYNQLFQRCMNGGSILADEPPKPVAAQPPAPPPLPPSRKAVLSDIDQPLLVEKAVRPLPYIIDCSLAANRGTHQCP